MGNTLDVLCSASSPRPGHSAKVQEQTEEVESFPQEMILLLGAEEKEEVCSFEGIKLTIYHHPIKISHHEEIMSRSFVTRGLALYGHMEIILTVLIEKGEDPHKVPSSCISLFKWIAAKAMEGCRAYPGTISTFPPLLRPYFQGAIYAPSDPNFPILPLDPYPQLTLLLAYREELSCGMAIGSFRVLNRLASRSKFFPFPLWNDLDRKSVVSAREMDSSQSIFLDSLGCLLPYRVAPRVYLDRDSQELCVFIDHEFKEIWKETVFQEISEQPEPENFAFSLPTYPHWQMDSSLFWFPQNGREHAANVGPWNAKKTNGSSLLIIIDQKVAKEKKGRPSIVEDGFAFALTPSQWKEFQEIVENGGELQIEKLRFIVRNCEEIGAPSIELDVSDEDLERMRNFLRLGQKEEDGDGPELPPIGTTISHPKHNPHELTVTDLSTICSGYEGGGFSCDICERYASGKSFHCSVEGCNYDICARCGDPYVKKQQGEMTVEDSCS